MKAVYRSPLFWLGLFPGLFLIWAREDSMTHYSYVTTPGSGRNYFLSQYRGVTKAFSVGTPVVPSVMKIHRAPLLGSEDPPWFFPRVLNQTVEPGLHFTFELSQTRDPTLFGLTRRGIIVPHSFLITLWLVVFLGAIYLRRRRHQRHQDLQP